MPPFETALTAEEVAALLPRGPRIPVAGGHRERFGRRRDVPVTVLRDSPPLRALHTAALDALESAGAVVHDRRHTRAGYRPHVTDQRGDALAPGERSTLTELALVARTPGAPRRVVARIPLR